MYLSQDYRDIIELFNINGVQYLLVGAYAMTMFGYARSTYDIDLWISKSEENIEKTIISLSEFGVPFDIDPSDLKAPYSIIQIGVAPNRIDILTDIDGVGFDEAWGDREVKKLGDLDIFVASLDTLIKNKEASPRSKDKIDVIELKSLKSDLNESNGVKNG